MRRKIVEHVIGQALVDKRCRRDRIAGIKQRVAIGGRLSDHVGGDGAICAGTILNEKVLAEISPELIGNGTRQHVWAAARRKADEDMNRTVRILLRTRHAGEDGMQPSKSDKRARM